MNDAEFIELSEWITATGLAGGSETAMLTEFCSRAVAIGLPLAGALVILDTLDPVYEGHALRWERDKGDARLNDYGRTNEGEPAENWRRSPIYHLLESGESLKYWPMTDENVAAFPNLATSRTEGMTGFLCIINRFAAEGTIGEMDCIYSVWTTGRPGGFDADDIEAMRRLVPFLALALKCASFGRIATTLAETYLGRDAGRMVMQGRIARGVADRIDAVLWFSDLSGFTRITDTADPEHVIPLLNDYAEAVISAVHGREGDVLKLIGDGVLAIFRADDRGRACDLAIAAALDAKRSIIALNQRRESAGLATTSLYLGLHVGEVFFGNIGSTKRLDFTVIGPAVNEVSRIAAMCRSVDQPLLVSAAFAASLGEARERLVSVGRYALRGVGSPQELFTLDPAHRKHG